jgi:casein kinase II subunit beta
MQWLRLRPETAAELDTVDWRGRWITGEESEDDRGLEPDTHGPAEEFDPVRFSLR